MSFIQCDGLTYFVFESFQKLGIKHGVFSRLGGVSPSPWKSLNLGGTVGDSRQNVIENRKKIFDIFGRNVSSIYDVWQVHSDIVLSSNQPRPLDQPHEQGDAILTNQSQITLFMRFADCVPILLYDPVQHVVGIVHAGWQGTVKKIAAKTVEKMVETYRSDPKNILAGIGPSIGPDHYTIGEDVISQVKQSYNGHSNEILIGGSKSTKMNLWKANEIALKEAGVVQIEQANICTACDLQHWYSHRAEHGKTGRFGALITLG